MNRHFEGNRVDSGCLFFVVRGLAMTVYVQMSFEDWLGETTPSVRQRTPPPSMGEDRRRWCRAHKRWDCPHHTGRRAYVWLYEEIVRAMRAYCAERKDMGHKVEPMLPHDVWVYLECEELPHIVTMRKYMKRLVERGRLLQVGARSGYVLAE